MNFYEASQLHLLVFASIKLAGDTALRATSGQQDVSCDGQVEIKLLLEKANGGDAGKYRRIIKMRPTPKTGRKKENKHVWLIQKHTHTPSWWLRVVYLCLVRLLISAE